MTSLPASGRQPRNLLTARAHRPLSVRGQTVLWVGSLTLAGAVLRFLRLGDQGLWYDESFTAMLVRHSPRVMLALIPHTEATPPLYYCLAWAWTRAFGRGAFGLRSLSACAGTALIPIGFGASSEILRSRRAGIVCAALVAFDPLLWWYSQEARAYELLAALCGLSLWAFARALRDPRRRTLGLWALASALALWTHYFAAVLVLPEAVWLVLVHHRRRGAWIAVALLGACGLALVPLAVAQAAHNHDAWIARSSLSLRAAQIIPQLLIGTGAPERALLKLVALVCAGSALALLAFAPPPVRREARIAGGLALAGAAVTVAPLAFGIDEVLTRNLIELWLPLAVCAAAGVTLTRHRPLRALGAAAAVGLCAVGLAAILGVLGDPRLQRPDWPALVRALGDRPPAGEGRLIVVQRERGLMPLQIYLPGLHWLNRPARLSQVDVLAMRSVPGKLCWWGAECNLVASRLQTRYRLRGFAPVRHLRVAQFRVLELRARRPTLLTRPELAHALTATELPHDGLLVQG